MHERKVLKKVFEIFAQRKTNALETAVLLQCMEYYLGLSPQKCQLHILGMIQEKILDRRLGNESEYIILAEKQQKAEA